MKTWDKDKATRAGVIGAVVIAAAVGATSNYDNLPFLSADHEIKAIFADASGIRTGDKVEFVGVNVGQVTDIALRGTDVEVTMKVRDDLDLGSSPSAQMKTRAVLGAKAVVLVPSADDGRFDADEPIPMDRTRAAYDVPKELGDIAANVEDINIDQLSDALHTTSDVLEDTSPELHTALDGVARLSDTIGSRDEALRALLADGSEVTNVLAERRSQINALLVDGNTLFGEVDARRAALESLTTNVSAVAQQLSGLVADNREQLRPTLDRLNRVLELLERNRDNLGGALVGASKYARTLNEALGSGPFFQAFVANLVPGQFIQPFIDAALGDGRVPTPPPGLSINGLTTTEAPR